MQHWNYASEEVFGLRMHEEPFLCRYLRLPALRRELHEGLQVVENCNGANVFIYSLGGETASNLGDDQEITMLSLHPLQICLVYINTLMIQRLPAEPWCGRLTPTDLYGLTPLLKAKWPSRIMSGCQLPASIMFRKTTFSDDRLQRNSGSPDIRPKSGANFMASRFSKTDTEDQPD